MKKNSKYTHGREVDIRFTSDTTQQQSLKISAIKNDRALGHEVYQRIEASYKYDDQLITINEKLDLIIANQENKK